MESEEEEEERRTVEEMENVEEKRQVPYEEMSKKLFELEKKDEIKNLTTKIQRHLWDNKDRFCETYKVHVNDRIQLDGCWETWKMGKKKLSKEVMIKMLYYAWIGGMRP